MSAAQKSKIKCLSTQKFPNDRQRCSALNPVSRLILDLQFLDARSSMKLPTWIWNQVAIFSLTPFQADPKQLPNLDQKGKGTD